MPNVDISTISHMGDKQKALGLTSQALKPNLVSSYSQDKVIKDKFGENSEIKGGACLALSMHWIRMHQSNKNAPRFGDAGLMNGDQVMVAARNVQLAYQRAKGRSAGGSEQAAQQAGIEFACRLFGTSLIGSLESHRFDDSLASKLRRTHKYHIIAMTGFGIGHAIACYASSGKMFGLNKHVYLFDPNIGELKIPENDLNYTFEALTGRYKLLGSNFNGCFLAEIKP